MKKIAKKFKIWEYVDSDDNRSESKDLVFPQFSDYLVEESSAEGIENGAFLTERIQRSATRFTDLNDQQKKKYKMKFTTFQMTKKMNDRITHEIRVMNAAIKTFAKIYISSNKMKASVRDIFQFLATKYQRTDDEITKQLFEQLQQLKDMKGGFGFETIFVKEFLKAERP